jgi:predicted regulator of Ras-like GTPase activity (Roadblock/LC7/MglB family)
VKHILEPLAKITGVRTAALVTNDGVPITMQGRSVHAASDAATVDALAALAAGWVGEVNRATAPLAWDAPRHLVLRAVRGTLVAMQAPGALLVVVLDSGASAEDLRLPMEAAVGRMLRHLRQPTPARAHAAREGAEHTPASEPRAPLPGVSSAGLAPAEPRHAPAVGAGPTIAPSGDTRPTNSGN